VSIRSAPVLHPLVRVEEEPAPRLTSFHRSPEGLDHQRGVRCCGQTPPHHTTGIQVQHDREVRPASCDAHIGNISAPNSIRRGRLEGPVEVIGSRLGCFRRQTEFRFARLFASQLGLLNNRVIECTFCYTVPRPRLVPSLLTPGAAHVPNGNG